jgi:DNA-binding IclR family transcriptional regulator
MPTRAKHSLVRQSRSAASSKSLQKAIRILLHLGENGPERSLTEFSSALRLNKTTVHRLLRALQKFHLVERNPHNEKYRLGLKFHALGARAVLWRSLPYDARPYLVELSRRSDETAILAIPGAGGIICLDSVNLSVALLTARLLPGDFIPAHCTAYGRAILSWLPNNEVWAILRRRGMHRYTPNTCDNPRDLFYALEVEHRRGYAADHGELEAGLVSFAAPILYRGNRIVGSIGVSGPKDRFLLVRAKMKIDLVKTFAARLSKLFSRGPADFATISPPYVS